MSTYVQDNAKTSMMLKPWIFSLANLSPSMVVAKQPEEIFQLRNWIKDLSAALARMKALEQKVADLEKELSIRNRSTSSNPISLGFCAFNPCY